MENWEREYEEYLDAAESENYSGSDVVVEIHPWEDDDHLEYLCLVHVKTYNGVPISATIEGMTRIMYCYITGDEVHRYDLKYDEYPEAISEAAKEKALNQVSHGIYL